MNVVLILSFVGLVFGLVGLWWSSDKSVEFSLQLSKLFGITTFFIGFVLMAIATGLPELSIAIASLWHKVPGMAAGDILGSNLIDISLVLGLPAVIFGTLNVRKEEKLPLMLMLIVTSFVMAFVFIVGILTPIYGVILIALYFATVWWLWKTKAVKVVPQEEAVEELSGDGERIKRVALKAKIFVAIKLLFSLLLVVLFSKLSVDSAITITRYFALSTYIIGATIFAVGTSLPELALSFHAVRKKEYALAFGNAFGSVLEQATLILGFLAIGTKKPLDIIVLRPIAPLMFIAYAVVAHSLLKKTKVGRQEGLGRGEGIILLLLFLVHLVYWFLF
jgi:cation:H+ antiporter